MKICSKICIKICIKICMKICRKICIEICRKIRQIRLSTYLTYFREIRYRLWMGAADIPPAVPCLTVRYEMQGVCPAGGVGGQAAQPGSTRTPSPSVQLGAVGWSPQCPARGRRLPRRHRHKGQTVKLRGNPEGQRYRPGVATSYGHHVVAWG